jgi:hypothetical protein
MRVALAVLLTLGFVGGLALPMPAWAILVRMLMILLYGVGMILVFEVDMSRGKR